MFFIHELEPEIQNHYYKWSHSSWPTLESVEEYCRSKRIKTYMVTKPGYAGWEKVGYFTLEYDLLDNQGSTG